VEASSKILDQRIQKVQLRRRIERVERVLLSKVDQSELSEIERDLRVLIAAKAEVRDVEGVLGKKATVAELQQMREYFVNQIEDVKRTGGGVGSGVTGPSRNEGAEEPSEYPTETKDELTRRFELLYRQFQDLGAHLSSFVPRTEVEAAMHTVLNEVKIIKSNYVDVATVREKLKKKSGCC